MNKIEKPWGYEEILVNNGRYVIKKLFVKKGHKLSLQYHNEKDETLYIVSGKCLITRHDDVTQFRTSFVSGGIINLPHKVIHRIEAITDTFIGEVSTPELEDVVRLEDDYGRAS